MEIIQHKTYKATIQMQRRDDLQYDIPPDGTEVKVVPGWIIEKGEYKGDWAMLLNGGCPWLPERDLKIIGEWT